MKRNFVHYFDGGKNFYSFPLSSNVLGFMVNDTDSEVVDSMNDSRHLKEMNFHRVRHFSNSNIASIQNTIIIFQSEVYTNGWVFYTDSKAIL